ncbi:MAG: hypothetical protein JWQ81_1336 [Amycolatopsis sp.]|uniref:hypothetical protein n=1 Tax=Amycolatopsis sp. TaxID=37632 RepID=UPI00262E507C|nr:hypothetical protein [Amycolatopsis sp.]MCU1680597.1 hypothetical protein [Amycolatopsis sp.]
MGSVEISSGKPTPLEQSGHPLVFLAAAGDEAAAHGEEFRSEVMGLGQFQKEGLVTDLATGRAWRLVADEGKYLRGTDMGPAPLMHWAAGLHGDVTMRIADLAQEAGIDFSELDVSFAQGFASKGSFARGEAVALVFDLKWKVAMRTGAPKPAVESVVEEALRSSPAVGALTGELEGVFALSANGRAVPVLGVPQSHAPAEVDPFLRYANRPSPVEAETLTEELQWKQPASEAAQQELGDDQSGTIAFYVCGSGPYRVDSGLVESRIDFPGAGASRWTLISDRTNRRAPSPLAYFSLGTAFCYHTQLCRYVAVRRLPAGSPRLVQGSTFTGEPFDTQLFINGSVDDAQAKSLLTAAANTCYAHRALTVPVESGQTIEVQA